MSTSRSLSNFCLHWWWSSWTCMTENKSSSSVIQRCTVPLIVPTVGHVIMNWIFSCRHSHKVSVTLFSLNPQFLSLSLLRANRIMPLASVAWHSSHSPLCESSVGGRHLRNRIHLYHFHDDHCDDNYCFPQMQSRKHQIVPSAYTVSMSVSIVLLRTCNCPSQTLNSNYCLSHYSSVNRQIEDKLCDAKKILCIIIDLIAHFRKTSPSMRETFGQNPEKKMKERVQILIDSIASDLMFIPV